MLCYIILRRMYLYKLPHIQQSRWNNERNEKEERKTRERERKKETWSKSSFKGASGPDVFRSQHVDCFAVFVDGREQRSDVGVEPLFDGETIVDCLEAGFTFAVQRLDAVLQVGHFDVDALQMSGTRKFVSHVVFRYPAAYHWVIEQFVVRRFEYVQLLHCIEYLRTCVFNSWFKTLLILTIHRITAIMNPVQSRYRFCKPWLYHVLIILVQVVPNSTRTIPKNP